MLDNVEYIRSRPDTDTTFQMTSANDLASLPEISVASLSTEPPVPVIKTEEDVLRWHQSSGFHIYALFTQRLNEAIVGHRLGEIGESSQVMYGALEGGSNIL